MAAGMVCTKGLREQGTGVTEGEKAGVTRESVSHARGEQGERQDLRP